MKGLSVLTELRCVATNGVKKEWASFLGGRCRTWMQAEASLDAATWGCRLLKAVSTRISSRRKYLEKGKFQGITKSKVLVRNRW